jgi:transcriptional regulator GlxA family with amidase domain
MTTNRPHTVCFLIYPGVASFDVAGPAQALRATGLDHYKVVLCSVSGGVVESDCPGLSFDTVGIADLTAPIDTLIIPGGTDAPTISGDQELIQAVTKLAARAARVASVCTGAFLAAEAGLLTGRRAATHWAYCDEFERRYQSIKLERDPIWIHDGGIWTSGGVSASVDLTLALIEDDLGIEASLQVARSLVLFFKRPGGQSQFSTVLSGQIADAGGPMQKLITWIAANLGSDLRPGALADKAGVSLRTLARNCLAQTGMTPAKLVESLRVEAARDAIEQTQTSFSLIAHRFGLRDEQGMRRAFVRQVSATPSEIRASAGVHKRTPAASGAQSHRMRVSTYAARER